MNYFIATDCETGGIGDDKSLLTAYFAFLRQYDDGSIVKLDELDLKIKPNDDVYRITTESLEITHINLIQHNKGAISEKQAGTKLYDKLRIWYSDSGNTKLIPIGHNVAFDIRRITNTLVNRGSWEQYVSYRVLDTCTIAQFLRLTGNLPTDLSCGLDNLRDHFKIEMPEGAAHEAKYDTLVTVKVLQHLMEIVSSRSNKKTTQPPLWGTTVTTGDGW